MSQSTNNTPRSSRRFLPKTPDSQIAKIQWSSAAPSPVLRHRRLDLVKSADPLRYNNSWLSAEMKQPIRSQSFKHRPSTTKALPIEAPRRSPMEEMNPERRRSTPTITRRGSLQRSKLEPRTDVWPEPKQASEVEERFLKLPDSEDYTRVRQFKIDARGAVVNRGDSFRRKRQGDKSPSPYALSDSARDSNSRSESVSSGDEHHLKRRDFPPPSPTIQTNGQENDHPAPTSSHLVYKVYVVGDRGTGKSALISQFNSSEFKNAFADEIEEYENTVSICIGGEECDLVFFESDMADPLFLTDEVSAFLVLYSIDSRSSFKQATYGIEMIRNRQNLQHIPVILAGNKADLERKRAVARQDVKEVAARFCCEQFEISVALNHDVDDLLVGLLAEIKDAFVTKDEQRRSVPISPRVAEIKEKDDFRAAIRRYSQRKKKESDSEQTTAKCSVLSPSGFFNKLKQWKRNVSPRITI
ncbi:unnamed protein product, partial [Mesorhabditis belari]|uniref:Uncharacterized protein n=1 Tax=Mesorhabditis belari TaxID=2138241 RepID=A0AAF3ED09_9BILA